MNTEVGSLLAGVEGGRYFFNMVREGDQVMFATDDETESTLWVQAIYRATGQSHKPVPTTTQPSRLSNTQLSKEKGGRFKGRSFVERNCVHDITVLNYLLTYLLGVY